MVFGFVTLDSIPTDPHFKAARQSGAIESMEIDEGMFYLGLLAASQRVPFLPTRAGLGSDVLRVNPSLRTVTSPYDDGEELVAMPALRLDAAVVHVNRADANGSGQILGPDPFFDELFLGAADRRFVTTERIVDTDRFASEGPLQTMCISRLLTDGVVETPGGAHFTACVPDYRRDEEFQRSYVAAAADAELWAAFAERYLEVTEAEYQARHGCPEVAGEHELDPEASGGVAASPGPSTAPSPAPRCSGATAR